MKFFFKLTIFFLFSPFVLFSQNDTKIKVFVLAVHDGDSYKVRFSDTTIMWVRLGDNVDCPEVRSNHICAEQPYGREVANLMRQKLKHKYVMIDTLQKDLYGRMVVDMWLDGESISRFILKNGYGWYTPERGKSNKYLAQLRNSAKKLKKGLWAQEPENIIEPSIFRQKNQCK